MNLREDQAPVVARGKDGRLGVVIIDTKTKKPVKPWKAVDDLTGQERDILRPYQQPGGRNNYRLDPDLFKKIEAAKNDPNPKLSPTFQYPLKPDPNQSSPIFQRPTIFPQQPKPEPPKPEVPTPTPTPTPTPKPEVPTPTPTPKPEVPKPKPTLDPKLKADLDKFAPKINQDWAASNERLARVELARAQQRAAGKSVFDKEFRKTKVNPIMYKQPSVEKEAYEVVLDYLLSEGHAETVEEAHYVMMQMDAEYIQSIVEQQAPDAKYYRNYLNDVLPGSAGPERQMPLMPPNVKGDALKQWMKSRGFPQAKKKSNNSNIA